MANFQPPPTWADPVIVNPRTREGEFNPVWLKWFLDIVDVINNSGGGGGTITHNSTAGLQGGTANQYYHLTSGEYTGTGTGVFVRKTGAALATPDIGVATGTSLQAIIGNVTPAAGTFTALTSTGATTLGDNAADVFTVTSDKVVTSLAGGLNLPLQASFSAYLSTTQLNKVGTVATTYTIIFDTEIQDQNADYNNATGVFTAPVTGRYLFTSSVLLIGQTISNGSQLFLTTSNRSWVLNGTARPAGTSWQYMAGSAIVDMDASDTAQIDIQAFGEAADTVDVYGQGSPIYTWFTGQLIA